MHIRGHNLNPFDRFRKDKPPKAEPLQLPLENAYVPPAEKRKPNKLVKKNWQEGAAKAAAKREGASAAKLPKAEKNLPVTGPKNSNPFTSLGKKLMGTKPEPRASLPERPRAEVDGNAYFRAPRTRHVPEGEHTGPALLSRHEAPPLPVRSQAGTEMPQLQSGNFSRAQRNRSDGSIALPGEATRPQPPPPPLTLEIPLRNGSPEFDNPQSVIADPLTGQLTLSEHASPVTPAGGHSSPHSPGPASLHDREFSSFERRLSVRNGMFDANDARSMLPSQQRDLLAQHQRDSIDAASSGTMMPDTGLRRGRPHASENPRLSPIPSEGSPTPSERWRDADRPLYDGGSWNSQESL